MLSRCVCVYRINLGGEGNALYPVLCCCFVVALMESMRSLDASSLPLNRDQFLDLASSLNEFFLQNGLIKSEPDSSGHLQQMVPQPQMPMHPANFHQELSPQMYQSYPGSDDQTPSPGMSSVCHVPTLTRPCWVMGFAQIRRVLWGRGRWKTGLGNKPA